MVGCSGLAGLCWGVLYIEPLPLMICLQLPLYKAHVLSHSYWEPLAVVTLVDGDSRVSNVCRISTGFMVLILDSMAIAASYVMIFRTMKGLATPDLKGTCGSHICAILIFYVPIAVSSLIPNLVMDCLFQSTPC